MEAARTQTPVPTSETLVGRRYVLGRTLGTGATTVVHEALDTVHGTPVAVTLLQGPYRDDPVARLRLAREADVLHVVKHPHVVALLDTGEDPLHGRYTVTELFTGESLASLLARQRASLSVREAMEVVLPVLDGLAAAHAAGVVHRDIRPESIYLHTEGGQRMPKLFNFKSACLLADFDASEPGVTAPGQLLGEVPYVAPEQAISARDVDARADVWSVGVVLYRALTGRVPFEASDVGSLLAAVLDVSPASPVDHGVPPSVASVTLRCLTVDRDARPSNAAVLKRALYAAVGVSHVADAAGASAPVPPIELPANDVVLAPPAPSARPTVALGPPAAAPPRSGLLPPPDSEMPSGVYANVALKPMRPPPRDLVNAVRKLSQREAERARGVPRPVVKAPPVEAPPAEAPATPDSGPDVLENAGGWFRWTLMGAAVAAVLFAVIMYFAS